MKNKTTNYTSLSLKIIGHIHTDFPEKFGIPRQSGLVSSLVSSITFEPEYQNPDCFRGLEAFSHLWLLWGFSENQSHGWTPTVRPPRLGGNKRTGVFASRSPFRPNPIGLSSVCLEKIDITASNGPVLYVSGADLMDDTPIYDIKPYLAYTDSHPAASASFAGSALSHRLHVHYSKEVLSVISQEKQAALLEILSLDPRPSYQRDDSRIYGMSFGEYDVHFRVKDADLYISNITSKRKPAAP